MSTKLSNPLIAEVGALPLAWDERAQCPVWGYFNQSGHPAQAITSELINQSLEAMETGWHYPEFAQPPVDETAPTTPKSTHSAKANHS
ncbi:hypothetical protein [Halioxenophilus sp. WMMB6]|uniref:hypothetical protein n=1 Tax=Halioxenophilus sp. WMMB6 TaxID=3073815 RepID=UPI00295E9FFB|nr:hypothetical protein [Halioxenophilus sp. WMMB6]